MACSKCGIPHMVGSCGGGSSAVGACGSPAVRGAKVGNVPEFNPDYYNAHPEVARPWWWNWWSVQQNQPQNQTYWWWWNTRWMQPTNRMGPVDSFLYNIQRSSNAISQQAHDLAVLAIMAWNDGNALAADLRTIDWTISMMQQTAGDWSLSIAQLQDLRPVVANRLRQIGG